MSISERILKSLESSSALFVEIAGLKYLPYRMIWGNNLQGYKRDSVQSVLSRLNKRGFLEKRVDQGQVYLSLTELGSKFLIKKQHQVSLSLTPTEKKWDGLYRFVCFDIPESDRVVRDLLRRSLKAAQAVCWQRSIWVTKSNITRDLNEFFDQNGLADNCSVLEVKEIYSLKLKQLLETN